MTLDNLLSLVGGRLLSQPTITGFNAITDRVSRIQRGDLFVCVDKEMDSINEALEKGAYGIIFDKFTPKLTLTLDDETAWIEVDSSFEAHLKLLRFHLMPKELEVFYADLFTLEYISMMKSSNECKIMSDDISEIVTKLWHVQDGQKLIIKDQADIITLFPMAQEITNMENIKLEPISPLESKLTFNNQHYEREKIPEILHEPFKKALTFLENHHMGFNLSMLTFPKSFNLIFCDNFLTPKEFGKGNLTLLFTDDINLAVDFLSSSKSLTPWIKSRLFLNENLKNLSYNGLTIFKDQKALLKALKQEIFDLAVICGASVELLTEAEKPTQLSLF